LRSISKSATTTSTNASQQPELNRRKKSNKPKGTHSWYAVPNKTNIMVEQRVTSSASHGPYFRPGSNQSNASSVKFLTEREKEMVRIEKRLSNKRWATQKFADRALSNRVKPYETYHEQPAIKFLKCTNYYYITTKIYISRINKQIQSVSFIIFFLFTSP